MHHYQISFYPPGTSHPSSPSLSVHIITLRFTKVRYVQSPNAALIKLKTPHGPRCETTASIPASISPLLLRCCCCCCCRVEREQEVNLLLHLPQLISYAPSNPSAAAQCYCSRRKLRRRRRLQCKICKAMQRKGWQNSSGRENPYKL